MICDFLCASLNIELARLEDCVETQLQYYLKARNCIAGFRSRLPEIQGRSEHDMADLQRRFMVLLGYDFEAAVKLKSYNDLPTLVGDATDANADGKCTVLETMAHIVLGSDAQIKMIFKIMQRLLDKMIRIQSKKLDSISRLIRNIVQLAFVRDIGFAEEMLSQAVELARNSDEQNPYPVDELQWLVGT